MTAVALPSRPLSRLPATDPRLMAATLVMALLVPPLVALEILDARSVGDVGALVKPIKFALSLAVHAGTMALLLPLASEALRASRGVRVAIALVIGSSLFEMAYILWRGARAEASHFNVGDPFASLMFSLMGVLAVTLVLATAYVGWRMLADRGAVARPAMRHAAGLGLLAGGLLGLVSGVAISAHGGYRVGIAPADAPLVPFLGWSLATGDLRVAHFIGLHAMQAVPLAALVLGRRDDAAVRRMAGVVAAVLAVLTVAAIAAALAGLPVTVLRLSGPPA